MAMAMAMAMADIMTTYTSTPNKCRSCGNTVQGKICRLCGTWSCEFPMTHDYKPEIKPPCDVIDELCKCGGQMVNVFGKGEPVCVECGI